MVAAESQGWRQRSHEDGEMLSAEWEDSLEKKKIPPREKHDPYLSHDICTI